jgi:transcriptional regulator with XRE-family HTH domain
MAPIATKKFPLSQFFVITTHMTAKQLQKCIAEHPKKQTAIAKDLGISSGGFSKWVNGHRTIDQRDEKLLRLYFFNEMPFELIRSDKATTNQLLFTEAEWQIISILSKREGYINPRAWITAKIRGYLDNNPTAKALARKPNSLTEEPSSELNDAFRKLTGPSDLDEASETA